MQRGTRISVIDLSRQQCITAATMRNAARESRATAASMVESANRMRNIAGGAAVEARRQLLEESFHA
jgi:hypothetical protein